MKHDYKNKVVLITGAARGIGKVIAEKYLRAGAVVEICDIDEDAALKTVADFKQISETISFTKLDLTSVDEIKEVTHKIHSKHGRIDVLINNARAGANTEFLEETEQNWDLTLSVNLKSVFFLCQQVVSLMKSSGGCSIINIGSVAGQLVCHQAVGYHVTKSAIEQLTKYLSVHAGEHGVRVNTIIPGLIIQDEHIERFESEGNQEFRDSMLYSQPTKKYGTSEDIANAALFLSSEDARFISGTNLVVDGALTVQEQTSLVLGYKK